MPTYLQAIIMGLLQGAAELFPISSLGHSVLVAWLFNWHTILADQSKSESFFLSLLVMLHVGTVLALFIFYRKTWWRIIKGFFGSIQKRELYSVKFLDKYFQSKTLRPFGMYCIVDSVLMLAPGLVRGHF